MKTLYAIFALTSTVVLLFVALFVPSINDMYYPGICVLGLISIISFISYILICEDVIRDQQEHIYQLIDYLPEKAEEEFARDFIDTYYTKRLAKKGTRVYTSLEEPKAKNTPKPPTPLPLFESGKPL